MNEVNVGVCEDCGAKTLNGQCLVDCAVVLS